MSAMSSATADVLSTRSFGGTYPARTARDSVGLAAHFSGGASVAATEYEVHAPVVVHHLKAVTRTGKWVNEAPVGPC